MTQSTTSKSFAYEQVRREVLGWIRDRNLHAGDRLPSDVELARHFKVNHRTVRRGIADLVDKGVVVRRVGAGTFINVDAEELDKQLSGFADSIFSKPDTTTYDLTIGVLVAHHPQGTTFIAQLLEEFRLEANGRNIRLLPRFNADGEDLVDCASDLARQGCDAIVVINAGQSDQVLHLSKLVHESPVPVVLSGYIAGLEEYSYEPSGSHGLGDRLVVQLACHYFHALGHRQLAFLGPDDQSSATLQIRMFAFARCAAHIDIDSRIALVGQDACEVEHVLTTWSKLAGPMAVVCYDDDMAIRLILAAANAGVRVGKDILVLGCNDIPLASSTNPPLSSIEFDAAFIARGMLMRAESIVRKEPASPLGTLHFSLIVRESCGGRAQKGDKIDDLVHAVYRQVESTNKIFSAKDKSTTVEPIKYEDGEVLQTHPGQ